MDTLSISSEQPRLGPPDHCARSRFEALSAQKPHLRPVFHSRVPANEIVGLRLASCSFTQRGERVVHTDLNCLSVPQYAIDAEDRHVARHYGRRRAGGLLERVAR